MEADELLMIRPRAGMRRLMKDWIMSMGPKMLVSYVLFASERSKSNAGITQGRPLSQNNLSAD